MTNSKGAQNAVVIERSFDAPVELIWRMWTDPAHFAAWYGPDGASIPVAKMDVRAGGTRLVCMEMQTPGGPMHTWFTGEYREVVENERLVYTESLSDENGTVRTPSEMGMSEGHPITTEIHVDLVDLGGRTKMVMTHVGVPVDSPGAAGWAMAIDKLATRVRTHADR
ncbi:MAG: SRPBCC family protein [Acidimicrobiales bacterium]